MEPILAIPCKHWLYRNTQMCFVFLFPVIILLLTTIFRKYLYRMLNHAHRTYCYGFLQLLILLLNFKLKTEAIKSLYVIT